jgi:hypothetical protein
LLFNKLSLEFDYEFVALLLVGDDDELFYVLLDIDESLLLLFDCDELLFAVLLTLLLPLLFKLLLLPLLFSYSGISIISN